MDALRGSNLVTEHEKEVTYLFDQIRYVGNKFIPEILHPLLEDLMKVAWGSRITLDKIPMHGEQTLQDVAQSLIEHIGNDPAINPIHRKRCQSESLTSYLSLLTHLYGRLLALLPVNEKRLFPYPKADFDDLNVEERLIATYLSLLIYPL